ncbi:MAG: iron-sulfur cluster assembly scaffold protein [Rickettsiales bacterium TMED289]|nr:MAG: iron-sulfur cluster assembly scaffold protein [Rickettsiales bacterium TMED289]|tara:strand:- start:358 stop:759 length:402 start_codon:yes stop_codon:yes gene_type:complete
MELDILKIASDTKYEKKLHNYTHSALKKNPLCGDFIELKINIKKNIVKDIGYETKSCIYCQASASLVCKFIINNNLNKIVKIIKLIDNYYKNDEIIINGKLFKIFNKKNFKRKNCIYLPVRAISQALKIKTIQ